MHCPDCSLKHKRRLTAERVRRWRQRKWVLENGLRCCADCFRGLPPAKGPGRPRVRCSSCAKKRAQQRNRRYRYVRYRVDPVFRARVKASVKEYRARLALQEEGEQ